MAQGTRVSGNLYHNNIFVQPGQSSPFNGSTLPVTLNGNVYLKGAGAASAESSPLVLPAFDPALLLTPGFGGYYPSVLLKAV